jgi:hypothetical protein
MILSGSAIASRPALTPRVSRSLSGDHITAGIAAEFHPIAATIQGLLLAAISLGIRRRSAFEQIADLRLRALRVRSLPGAVASFDKLRSNRCRPPELVEGRDRAARDACYRVSQARARTVKAA